MMKLRNLTLWNLGILAVLLLSISYSAQPPPVGVPVPRGSPMPVPSKPFLLVPSNYISFGTDEKGAKSFENLHEIAVIELKAKGVTVGTNLCPTCSIRVESTNLLVTLTYRLPGNGLRFANVSFKDLNFVEAEVVQTRPDRFDP